MRPAESTFSAVSSTNDIVASQDLGIPEALAGAASGAWPPPGCASEWKRASAESERGRRSHAGRAAQPRRAALGRPSRSVASFRAVPGGGGKKTQNVRERLSD